MPISNPTNENAGSEKKTNFTYNGPSSYDATSGDYVEAKTLRLDSINRIPAFNWNGYLVQPEVSSNGQAVAFRVFEASNDPLTADTLTIVDNDSAPSVGQPLSLALSKDANMSLVADGLTDTVFAQTDGGTSYLIDFASLSPDTINVIDDYDAATNGTQVFVRIAPVQVESYCNLVSTTANNAAARFEDVDGNAAFTVLDSDDIDAFNFPLYFDEDAEDGRRFMVASPLNIDMWLLVRKGDSGLSALRIVSRGDAASLGVPVYIDDDAADPAERLLFVSPTNTNGTCITLNEEFSSEVFNRFYLPIYFDEDAADGSRIQCDLTEIGGYDFYVHLFNGRMIKITHNADASTDGVRIYVNEAAATPDLSLIFVSPTDTNGSESIDPNVTLYGIGGSGGISEVANGTDLSSEIVNAQACGFGY